MAFYGHNMFVLYVIFITGVTDVIGLHVITGIEQWDPPKSHQPGATAIQTLSFLVRKGHQTNNVIGFLEGGLLKISHTKNFVKSQSERVSANSTHDRFNLTLRMKIPRPHYDYDVRSTQSNAIYDDFRVNVILNAGTNDTRNYTWILDCAFLCLACVSDRPKCLRCVPGYKLQGHSCYKDQCLYGMRCGEHGTCTLHKSLYMCECPAGRSGPRCRIECTEPRCESCTEHQICYECQPGWTKIGQHCVRDPCDNSNCTQGHCVSYQDSSTKCMCNYGIGGRLCDMPI